MEAEARRRKQLSMQAQRIPGLGFRVTSFNNGESNGKEHGT